MTLSVPLLINPSARRGGARSRAERIVEVFRAAGVTPELWFSDGPGDIEAKVRDAVGHGHRSVIVAGGDGTLHEAVNGLMQAGGDAALGILPIGSGNDFCKGAGIDRDWRIAARDLAARLAENVAARRVDLGRCNARYFANGVGIGFDALVTKAAKSIRLPLGDFVYVIGVLRVLAGGFTTPELAIRANGFDYDGRATLANFANGAFLGGKFVIAPDAKVDDGQLDLVVATAVSRTRILSLLPALTEGTHLGEPEVNHCHVTRVTLTSAEPVYSHIDGELQPPASRFEIECLPGALALR